jgi:hypothetical protein
VGLHAFTVCCGRDEAAREGEAGRLGAENSEPQEEGGDGPSRKQTKSGKRNWTRPEGRRRCDGGNGNDGGRGQRLDERNERSRWNRAARRRRHSRVVRALDAIEASAEFGHDDLEGKRIEAAPTDLAVLH